MVGITPTTRGCVPLRWNGTLYSNQLAGGVLLMVTGSITIADMDPRQFCQTFFLARQHQDNDRHNYFVRNDIFRFLDVLPEVVQVRCRFLT